MVYAVAKVIEGTAAAISIGDDRNWDLESSIFDENCAVSKVELSPSLREDVKTALRIHLTLANLAKKAPNAKETLLRMDKLIKSANSLTPELRDLMADPLHTITFSLSGAGFTAIKLEMLISSLQEFQSCSVLARTAMHESTKGGSGPRLWPNLESFVLSLADIFNRAGGTESAAYSPNVNGGEGGRDTPFIRFVFHLLEQLPEELHVPFVPLGDAIYRILKKHRNQHSDEQFQ